MNLATITGIFQNRCHEGYSLCEVEVCDKQGNHICVIDKVEVMSSDTHWEHSIRDSSYIISLNQKLKEAGYVTA